jgi:hypothetical protein
MGLLSRLFGGAKAAAPAAKEVEYKGFVIVAKPYKASGGWQLAGEISKGGKVHKFVGADQFSSADEATEFSLKKGQLIVDQLGDGMFS